MPKQIKSLIPYIILLVLDFYFLPFLIQNTSLAMLFMLAVMPLIAFLTAAVYGIRHGFCLLLPVIAAVLFLPTIFIYYNSSAWVYTVFYAVIVLAGNGIGRVFYMKK